MRRIGRYGAAACVCASFIALFGYAVRADVPQVPTGTWTAAGAIGDIPRDAASTVLADGRLVVIGGSNADSQPVAQIAIYDSASGTWTRAGEMNEARAGHTATALRDGRILITGGRTSSGVTSSVEIYDPATGASEAAGALSLPRVDHAAARLLDGRVLIAGGSDGNAVLAIAEMFDPETGAIAPLAASLSTARAKLSATTLLDGHVLIAGGNDGSQDLASAEIFDEELGMFWATSSMRTARSGHTAVLLPHNNSVLIAGGTSNGTALSSVESFAHWNETFMTEPNSMSAQRSGAVAVPTGRDGVILVGGGGPADAELYGFATLKTDKDDYAPGEIVTFTGTGWQPGETVNLTISEYADNHYDFEYTAVADEFGNIVNREFYPREDETFHHMGMRFYVMARGIASAAQMTFTDSGTLTINFAGAGSGSVSGNGASTKTADFAACISNAGAGSCSIQVGSSGNVVLTATAFAGSTFAGWSSNVSYDPTKDEYAIRMNENKTVTATFQKSVTKATPIVTVTGGTFTYDGAAHPASATAMVDGVSVGGTFSFTYNGAAAAVDAGTYDVVASFTPADATKYNSATGNGSITISKATATVNVNGYTGVYDAAPHGATGSVNGVGGVDLSAQLTLGATFTDVPGGTAHWSFAGGANYTDQSGDVAIVISKATATVNVNGYTGVYDAAAHGATGTATGVGGVDLSAQLTLGATFTDVPGGTAHWSFTGGTNYTDQSGDVDIVINKATATVSVNGYTGVYDGAAHGATGTAKGVNGEELTGLNLGATFTDVPGGTAHWSFTGGTNYTDQSGDVDIVINKATATVSVNGYTGVYDAAPHGASGSVTGVGGANLSAQLTLGDTFTNVPGGTAHWSFTGGTNYTDQSGDVAIVINKATATVSVNGYTGVYDAAPHGASGSATGVGGANLSAQLTLGATFTDVPGGTAHWSFTGGTNYTDQSGDVAIVIIKASQSITVTTHAPASALYNTSFTVVANGGGSGNPLAFNATGACTNQNATFTMTSGYGTCTVTINQAGNNNYNAAAEIVETVNAIAWHVTGFYSPVTPTVSGAPIWNVVKGGSTVPLKFEIFAGVNGLEQTSLTAVKSMLAQQVNCTGGAALAVDPDQLADTGGTSLRYDGTQFIQNWKTPKTAGACFVVTMTAADSSPIRAYFQVK